MPSLPTPALGAIEIVLARYLAADDRALERCQALASRSLRMDVSDLGLVFTFVAERHGMQVQGERPLPADVTLTGGSAAFGRILFSGGREGLMGGGLRIEGDVAVAQRFAELFSGIDFDIADLIDARLGPVSGYFADRGLKHARALLGRVAREVPEQAAEYLREETRDVVGRWEHDKFVRAVDTLRADADRLTARVRRLDDTR